MNQEPNDTVINSVEVFIEIQKGSCIKYEYDKKKKALVCDRILHTPFAYPFNYGFIFNTLSLDGDPLDVVVLTDHELLPGSYVKCNILGCLETTDDEGDDPKIIACPTNKIDPTYDYRNITELPPHILEKIKYFFAHYKDLENKRIVVGSFLDKLQAHQILADSIERHDIEKNK